MYIRNDKLGLKKEEKNHAIVKLWLRKIPFYREFYIRIRMGGEEKIATIMIDIVHEFMSDFEYCTKQA